MSPAFMRDLRFGRGFETMILSWAKNKYPNAVLMEGSFKDYDIDASPSLLECKFDWKSQRTQNIVIEFEDRGKPSGIQSTKATHWIHCFWDEEWKVAITPIDKLREIVKDLEVVNGGDDFSTLMYRVPKNLLSTSVYVNIVSLSRIGVGCTRGS